MTSSLDDSFKNEFDILTINLQQIQASLRTHQERATVVQNRAYATITSQKEEINKLMQSTYALGTKIEECTKERKKDANQLNTLQNQLNTLQNELVASQNELNAEKNYSAEREKNIIDLKTKNEELSSKITSNQDMISDLQRELKTQNKLVKKLSSRTSNLQTKNADLSKELETRMRDTVALREKSGLYEKGLQMQKLLNKKIEILINQFPTTQRRNMRTLIKNVKLESGRSTDV